MPDFSYTAIDGHGQEHTGRCEAADVREATSNLHRRGLFPIAVRRVTSEQTQRGRRGRSLWLRAVRSRERALFTRQLSTLLRAGLPLVRALEVLARQERHSLFRQVLVDLATTIRSGGTLASALDRHPRVFDSLYISMVRAGEATGALDGVLERLAHFQEKSLRLRGKLATALIYPTIVLGVAVAILAGLLVFVVPRFRQIFADLLKGAPLPPLTQAVLSVSDAVRLHAVELVLAVAGLMLAGAWLSRTSRGVRWRDHLALRLPLLGGLIVKAVTARFSRTLGTLLTGGVPILPALVIARETCGNRRIEAVVTAVHDRVKAGASLARPLAETGEFPPLVASLVEVGEQTGQLGAMLGKVAEIYEEEVDTAVTGLNALMEPLLILFLALVVGTIVIALFLPLVRIVQLLA